MPPENHWSCRLEPSGSVRGIVHDQQGGPVAGALVEFTRRDGLWADLTVTDRDGRFVCHEVVGEGSCMVWSKSGEAQLPTRHGVIVLPDTEPVAIDLDATGPRRARLRVHPTLPVGFERAGVDGRVTQLDTGHSVRMPPLGQENAFEVGDLLAGPYRIEVGVAPLGVVVTAPVHLDGRGLWNLGKLRLPSPGRVRLLPPGRHLLLWRDEQELRSIEFEVQSGLETVLSIGRS